MLQTITSPIKYQPAEPMIFSRHDNRPWTADDLHALANDERHFEIVRGELIMMSPASPVQGRYASRLDRALGSYVDEHDLGEVYTAEPGFILQSEPDLIIRSPDVAFVSKERIPSADEQEGFWKLAPDLAVEIISPSETALSIQHKVQDYLAAGTRLIWLVYPQLQLVVTHQPPTQVRQYGIDDNLDGGEVLPDFRYPLTRLFR